MKADGEGKRSAQRLWRLLSLGTSCKMEGTQTATLTEAEHNGRRFYVLNDGQFFADVESGLVFAVDDVNCENPLGGYDGSATFEPLSDTPSHQMGALNLGQAGVDNAEAARLEGERRRQERALEEQVGGGM